MGLLTIFAKLFARTGGAPYVTISMTRPDGTPYGLPLSLARIDEKTFYFHCALEGVVRITQTEPPVGKRKQYDKQREEMKFSDPIK